jgi:hypothetical protein
MSNISPQSANQKAKESLALTIPRSIRGEFKKGRNEGWSQFHPANVEEVRIAAEILQINMNTLWEVVCDSKKKKFGPNEIPEGKLDALNALNQSLAALPSARIKFLNNKSNHNSLSTESPDDITNKIVPNVRPEASRDLREANQLGNITSIYHRLSEEKGEKYALQKVQEILQLGADTARISAELRLMQLTTNNKGGTKEANKLLLTIRDALYFDPKKTTSFSDLADNKLSTFHQLGIKECTRLNAGLSNYLWRDPRNKDRHDIDQLSTTLSYASTHNQLISAQSSPPHSTSKAVNFHADGFIGSGEEGTFGARKQNLGLAAFTHTEIDLKKAVRRLGRLFGIKTESLSKQDKIRLQAIAHNDLSIPFSRGLRPHLDQHLGVGAEVDLYRKNNTNVTGTLSLPESFLRIGNSFLSAEFALFFPNQPSLFLNINFRNNYAKDLKDFFKVTGLTTLAEQIQQTMKEAAQIKDREKDWKIVNEHYQEELYQLLFNKTGIQKTLAEQTKSVALQFGISTSDKQGMNNLFLEVARGIYHHSILMIQKAHQKRPGTFDGISISASFHGGSIPLIQPLFRVKDQIKEAISHYQINTVGEQKRLREATVQPGPEGESILSLDQTSNTKYYIRAAAGIKLHPEENNLRIEANKSGVFFFEIVREYPNTDKIVEITVHCGDPNADISQEFVSERNRHLGRVGFYSLNEFQGADSIIPSPNTNVVRTIGQTSLLQYVEPIVTETYRVTSSDTPLNRFVFKPLFKLFRLPSHSHTPGESTRRGHRH